LVQPNIKRLIILMNKKHAWNTVWHSVNELVVIRFKSCDNLLIPKLDVFMSIQINWIHFVSKKDCTQASLLQVNDTSPNFTVSNKTSIIWNMNSGYWINIVPTSQSVASTALQHWGGDGMFCFWGHTRICRKNFLWRGERVRSKTDRWGDPPRKAISAPKPWLP